MNTSKIERPETGVFYFSSSYKKAADAGTSAAFRQMGQRTNADDSFYHDPAPVSIVITKDSEKGSGFFNASTGVITNSQKHFSPRRSEALEKSAFEPPPISANSAQTQRKLSAKKAESKVNQKSPIIALIPNPAQALKNLNLRLIASTAKPQQNHSNSSEQKWNKNGTGNHRK